MLAADHSGQASATQTIGVAATVINIAMDFVLRYLILMFGNSD